MADVRDRPAGAVPPHLRDSHYPGAAKLGHGDGYVYPHDAPEGWVAQQYRPDEIEESQAHYWQPTGTRRRRRPPARVRPATDTDEHDDQHGEEGE